MVSLAKKYRLEAEPQCICQCGQVVYEIDTMYCDACGDMACEDCVTECDDCGRIFCMNCADSNSQCIRCALSKPKEEEKAFLVINRITTPIKNSAFMIEKTSLPNARDIRLTLEGVEYKYTYRALQQREEDKNKFDFFLYFEEVKQEETIYNEEFNKSVRDALRSWNESRYGDEYDDYGTDWMW